MAYDRKEQNVIHWL